MYPGDFARQRPDHPAFIMAAERTGLYYTAINSCLGADELAYIVGNSRSKVLITSLAKPPLAREALAQCPGVTLALVADSADSADAADTADTAGCTFELETHLPPPCKGRFGKAV